MTNLPARDRQSLSPIINQNEFTNIYLADIVENNKSKGKKNGRKRISV